MATSKTHLDEIINYPRKVIRALYDNRNFVSLLLNIPNADLSDPDIEDAYYNHMFDFGYVEGTITESMSFCCVDTDIYYETPTVKTVTLTMLVGVHKGLIKPNNAFKVFGNRRDNLIREIHYTLWRNPDFGIGGLEPIDRIRPAVIGKEFSGKIISFSVPEFAEAKNIKR